MQIRMLVGTGGPNGTACEAGEVYDLPTPLAQSWVALGRAEVVPDPSTPEPIVVQHADPVARRAPVATRTRR